MARANRRIEEIPELDVVRLYCDERLSAEEIGWRLGWSRSAIVSRLIHLGIARRTPWARNAVNCDINEVRRLYVVERLSLTAVGVRLGCSERTIRRLLEAAGVARRDDGSEPKHPRADFSGDITEKAYLIGVRIGDLHVAMEGSRAIVVKCTSTRAEQVELFRTLFQRYGHVYTDEAGLVGRKRQSIGMEVRLNVTFDFLLPKQDAVPHWILASDQPFFAFFAGYVDAEGYFKTCLPRGYLTPQARLEIRSYDAALLSQLADGLNARGIICPPARLRVRAVYSLNRLVSLIKPYIQHSRRRANMMRAWKATI